MIMHVQGREASKGVRHHPLKSVGSTGQQHQKPVENPLKDEAHPLRSVGSAGQQHQKPVENPLKDEAGKNTQEDEHGRPIPGILSNEHTEIET